jgi:hypothetical protein
LVTIVPAAAFTASIILPLASDIRNAANDLFLNFPRMSSGAYRRGPRKYGSFNK